MKNIIYIIIFFIIQIQCFAQKQPDSVSIYKTRKIEFLTLGTALYGSSVAGMYELWYKPYKQSTFHWVDDSKEWLQMDKAGHSYTAYQLNRVISNNFEWSGTDNNYSVIYGSGIAFLGMSTIEVFDGFSSGWGASATDLLADFSGVLIYSTQYLGWKEERIVPKFSYHFTHYAYLRPEELGSNAAERLLKDYNGQTYWLSFNASSFLDIEKLPKWLCLSLGYGGEEMISGKEFQAGIPFYHRYRQYYLSLDIDFKKIKTSSAFLKAFFYGLNMIKIPFPTLEFSENKIKTRVLYF